MDNKNIIIKLDVFMFLFFNKLIKDISNLQHYDTFVIKMLQI